MIGHIFDRFDVPALITDIDPRNAPSIRLAKRLGFRFTHRATGTWRIGEEECDSVYHALTRP